MAAPRPTEPVRNPHDTSADDGATRPALVVDVAVAALILAVELALAAGSLHHTLNIAWLVAGHSAVIVALTALARARVRAGCDSTSALLMLVTTATAGAVGSLAALLSLPLVARRSGPRELLQAWHERIAMSLAVDEEARMAEMVTTGRIMSMAAPAASSFTSVMTRSPMPQRQTALGIIARHFEPEYAPALKAALRSPEPVVRVQGAAVAARVRTELKDRLARALARAAAPASAPRAVLHAIAELEGYVASGLIDEADESRARAAVAEARTRLSRALDPRRLPLDDLSAAEFRALDGILLSSGRFAALRAARKLRRLGSRWRIRLRRFRRHPAALAKGCRRRRWTR